eukprot:scaffold7784_cov239-Pinguiococcus_pyrenoidosus.AAC.1
MVARFAVDGPGGSGVQEARNPLRTLLPRFLGVENHPNQPKHDQDAEDVQADLVGASELRQRLLQLGVDGHETLLCVVHPLLNFVNHLVVLLDALGEALCILLQRIETRRDVLEDRLVELLIPCLGTVDAS